MFYDDHKTVLMNGWIICRFVEISDFFFGSLLLGSSPGRSALQSAE